MAEPLKLSDEALIHVLRLAAPLHQQDRSAFLEAVAARLAGVPELGDGIVARVGAEEQRRFFSPPVTAGVSGQPQHQRKWKNGGGAGGASSSGA